MPWNDIWKIVLGVIAGFGGISGIIILVVKFVAETIAKRLEEKYTQKLNKELEKYKTELNKKEYVSKTRFDVEFSIYRELSVAFSNLVKSIRIFIPDGIVMVPVNKEARLKMDAEHYDAACAAFEIAQHCLNSNIPFITETIYNGYADILLMARSQLQEFEQRYDVSDLRPKEEKESFSKEAYKQTRMINDEWNKLNCAIREYISTLDILEV